jgi:hypothetical protein
MMKQFVTASLLLGACLPALTQDKKPVSFSVSGTAGITYEHYGLSVKPGSPSFYRPRRPYNQVRFNFQPTFQFSKNFSLPVNINVAAVPTNFAGPFSGFVPGAPKMNIGQWLTNPMNNIGLNPKYKWAELQLGTQYLNYSDLSTGDIGIFGAGVDLRPGLNRIKFFTGVSQPPINFFSGPPSLTGAYRRNNWMLQLGREKEGKYKVAFNFAKGRDQLASVSPAPPIPPAGVLPQEGFTVSFVSEINFNKGWYWKSEGAQSLYTNNTNTPFSSLVKDFEPFIKSRATTMKDYAGKASIGKRGEKFDIGIGVNYIGSGFKTVGYPFMQPDHVDYTLNTRFNAWKNKINVVASVGQRTNNLSNTTLKSDQFIGNINWFTQFSDNISLNISYNNFGFQAGSALTPFGVKNISNDLGINPSFTWSNSKVVHVLSVSYNYSVYDEKLLTAPFTVTSNKTHTAVLTYVPTIISKNLSPDFSIIYFYNESNVINNKLLTVASSISFPAFKKAMQFRGQLQYTMGKLGGFTANNNLVAGCTADVKLGKKLTWTNYFNSNWFKYGDELAPPTALIGANYLESFVRTGLQYQFGKKR